MVLHDPDDTGDTTDATETSETPLPPSTAPSSTTSDEKTTAVDQTASPKEEEEKEKEKKSGTPVRTPGKETIWGGKETEQTTKTREFLAKKYREVMEKKEKEKEKGETEKGGKKPSKQAEELDVYCLLFKMHTLKAKKAWKKVCAGKDEKELGIIGKVLSPDVPFLVQGVHVEAQEKRLFGTFVRMGEKGDKKKKVKQREAPMIVNYFAKNNNLRLEKVFLSPNKGR